jgi:ubiquinone/menaquinone biosynthesis C-methylase UbiE
LLDLGCGTGQLALPLAKYFEEVIGMDPEPEMIVETEAAAKCLSTKNVRWIIGGSEDLRSQMGKFRLVTMGRSFHWTDREATLRTLAQMVVSDGIICTS